jgi:hypothetical protein
VEEPQLKGLKGQDSTAALFEKAFGDWVPIFEREEMVGVATTGKCANRPSIKKEIEGLDARLAEFHEWNLGELNCLLELVGRIRDIVTT